MWTTVPTGSCKTKFIWPDLVGATTLPPEARATSPRCRNAVTLHSISSRLSLSGLPCSRVSDWARLGASRRSRSAHSCKSSALVSPSTLRQESCARRATSTTLSMSSAEALGTSAMISSVAGFSTGMVSEDLLATCSPPTKNCSTFCSFLRNRYQPISPDPLGPQNDRDKTLVRPLHRLTARAGRSIRRPPGGHASAGGLSSGARSAGPGFFVATAACGQDQQARKDRIDDGSYRGGRYARREVLVGG